MSTHCVMKLALFEACLVVQTVCSCIYCMPLLSLDIILNIVYCAVERRYIELEGDHKLVQYMKNSI